MMISLGCLPCLWLFITSFPYSEQPTELRRVTYTTNSSNRKIMHWEVLLCIYLPIPYSSVLSYGAGGIVMLSKASRGKSVHNKIIDPTQYVILSGLMLEKEKD